MTRAEDLRSDFERLGMMLDRLTKDEASAAAAIARERRIIGAELEKLEAPEDVSKVDEVGARRKKRESAAGTTRTPARRRQSRRGT